MARNESTEGPILALRDVSAHYGAALAVSGVSLQVRHGEVLSIVGANGAGKTTILRLMSGLMAPSKGAVAIDGVDVGKQDTSFFVRKGIAMSPEGRRIFPYMTVHDNLLTGAFILRDQKKIEEQLAKVFEMFPILKERERNEGGALSGGQQQMLAIGRAFMSMPRVLLLDEPTLGLAPKVVDEVFAIIARLKSQSMTIVLVEQNATLALDLADQVCVMAHGSVQALGSPQEIRQGDVIRQAYLGG